MNIEDGTLYRIEMIRDIELGVVDNSDSEPSLVEYSVDETAECEICEVDEKAQTCTLFFPATTQDEIDTFSRNVPMDCFKLESKQIITWEEL